jgi:L-ascorbate metabolism protein UlaG (beta-lactamase superfamily)
VLEGIKTEPVEEGTVAIWMLYNMGYVIKTPSACFGIDIYHRWALKLAPYLDFLCVTHNHLDHYSSDLIQAMFDANKPVLSNYLKKGTAYAYTSTTDKNYTIGKFTIRTAITDHNGTAEGKNFMTVFRIDCGDDTGHFTFLHIGDSNFQTAQYTNVQGALDVYIPRYAPVPHGGDENLIIGTGSGQVQPDYVLLSHILELGHNGVENSRWPLDMALYRASIINCERTYVPFWGEKLVWSNGELH